jgi:2',3'-cyclic-nucleotide 2'-phosphodiesterase (5'-nucleotidase family)
MSPMVDHVQDHQILDVKGVKVGTFGLLTQNTPITSTINMNSFTFEDYKKISLEKSALLR